MSQDKHNGDSLISGMDSDTARGQARYSAGIVGCGRIGCAFDDDPRRGYISTHAGAYAQTPGVVKWTPSSGQR